MVKRGAGFTQLPKPKQQVKQKTMKARIRNFKPTYAAQEVISCFKLQFYTSRTYEEFAELVAEYFDLTAEQWDAVLNEWETLQIARVKPQNETHPVMLQALKPFMP